MDFMRYERYKFSLPTSHNVSQLKWDLTFLTKKQFMKKYQVTSNEYELVLNGRSIS